MFAASNVKAAKAVFTEVQPQLVISDIAMPQADGLSFIRWVRSLSAEAGGQVPAMAVTAKVYEEDKQQVLQAGFNEHVNNPVDMDVLLSAIAALLQKPQMQSL